jgi:LPXTG-motif cell wall-anchored protein
VKSSRFFVIALALGLLLALTQAALAHSFIDHCTPEVGSTLPQPPKEVRCTYTDPVDVKQTVFAVFDANNNQVDNKDLKSDPNDRDGKTVVVTLNGAKITSGVYTVKWQTTSEDGHTTDGQWQFSVGAQPVPSVTLVSPTEDTKFDQDPAEVVVSIKTSSFQLGQNGRRWQVYLDDKMVAQVTDGSTSTTLKAVAKGDYALKVTLATDDKTIVATAGTAITIGPAEETPAPTTLPKTGADSADNLPLAVLLTALGALLLGAARMLRRRA